MAQTPAPRPHGKYATWVRHGSTLAVSGMTPRIDGVMQHRGQVGQQITIDQARSAAELCARRALACLAEGGGGLDHVAQVLALNVYVASGPDFGDHGLVADRASEVLVDALGDRGLSARVAVGVVSLPGGACVEISLTAALRDEPPAASSLRLDNQ